MEGENDWDKTKENIRPLRHGLPSASLSFADIVDPKASEELKAKRAEFEERIRNYSGDDPLAEIVAYISWIESAYPKGGAESGLEKLVKDCCLKYYNEAKSHEEKWHAYFDDERYVKLWLKMTRFANPFTIFECMKKSRIGTKIPDVYISWAAEVESLRNFEEAEKILDFGIEACADNFEHVTKLQAYRKQLLDRDCRFLVESASGSSELAGIEEERATLGGLLPVGKEKNMPPINRVGDNKLYSTTGVVPPRQKLTKKAQDVFVNSVQVMDVSSDESDVVSDFLPHLEDTLFPRSTPHRENLVTSAKLAKTTVKQKFKSNFTDDAIGFTILPDQNVALDEKEKKRKEMKFTRLDPPSLTHNSEKSVSDFKALKSSRPTSSKEDSGEPPCECMWTAAKFPSGINEFSFEEGMAETYKKRRLVDVTDQETSHSIGNHGDTNNLQHFSTAQKDNLETTLRGTVTFIDSLTDGISTGIVDVYDTLLKSARVFRELVGHIDDGDVLVNSLNTQLSVSLDKLMEAVHDKAFRIHMATDNTIALVAASGEELSSTI